EAYYAALITGYHRLKEPQKAKLAQQELETYRTKEQTAEVEKLDKATKGIKEEEKKYGTQSAQIWGEIHRNAKQVNDDVKEMEKTDPFKPWQQDLLNFEHILKDAGVTGLLTLKQNLQAAERAEKALNDHGIKSGKLWLEVQKAKLTASIALAQAEGKNADKEIRDLARIDKMLKLLTTDAKKARPTWDQFFDDLTSRSLKFGQAMQLMRTLVTDAIGQSVAAAVSGS